MVTQSLRYPVNSGWFRTPRLKLHGKLASLGVSGDFLRLRGFSRFLFHGLLLEVSNNAIVALLLCILKSSGWSERDAPDESTAPSGATTSGRCVGRRSVAEHLHTRTGRYH